MLFVYGGAFNPPTIAHYSICQKLIETFKPNYFYLLPVGPNYDKDGMVNYQHRYKMCQLMANKLQIMVSDMENQKHYEGTYYALKRFKKIDDDVYFVMGADNFSYLDKWINADRLIAEFKFIVINRDNFDIRGFLQQKFAKYISHFVVIDFDYHVSSTDFRNSRDRGLVIPEIYDYICQNDLY